MEYIKTFLKRLALKGPVVITIGFAILGLIVINNRLTISGLNTQLSIYKSKNEKLKEMSNDITIKNKILANEINVLKSEVNDLHFINSNIYTEINNKLDRIIFIIEENKNEKYK